MVFTMEDGPFPVDLTIKKQGTSGQYVDQLVDGASSTDGIIGFDTSPIHLLWDAVSVESVFHPDEDVDGSNLRRQSSQSSDGGASKSENTSKWQNPRLFELCSKPWCLGYACFPRTGGENMGYHDRKYRYWNHLEPQYSSTIFCVQKRGFYMAQWLRRCGIFRSQISWPVWTWQRPGWRGKGRCPKMMDQTLKIQHWLKIPKVYLELIQLYIYTHTTILVDFCFSMFFGLLRALTSPTR